MISRELNSRACIQTQLVEKWRSINSALHDAKRIVLQSDRWNDQIDIPVRRKTRVRARLPW